MVYMSKKKRRRVMRKRILGLSIAVLVIICIFVTIWQVGLGSTLVTVDGKSIRSGTLEGVHGFINYYYYGSFPDNSTAGKTKEEIAEEKDWTLIDQYYYLDSILVPLEVLKQHFAAQGKAFPTEEAQATIDEAVNPIFSDTTTSRLFKQNGVKKEHVAAYYEYVAAMDLFKDEVLEANPVTDEEARAYYTENISLFTTPASFQASHILLIDEEHTPERRAEIEQILERIHNGEDFAELAMEYSEDGSASEGGDLGTFYMGSMVAPFEEACIALEPGEVSDIVETEYGFHIIKMTSKEEESISSFEESREYIDSALESPRVTEALDLLTEAAVIVYKTLVNPDTGKPPVSIDELDAARGIVREVETDTVDGDEIIIE